MMLLFLLVAASAAKTQGAYDEVREMPEGQILVMRTLDWDHGNGSSERFTVHWLLLEDGSMRYDFDHQPPQTQDAHRRSCALQGMQPLVVSPSFQEKAARTASPVPVSSPRSTPAGSDPRHAWIPAR